MAKGGIQFGAVVHKNYVDFKFWFEGASRVWVRLTDTDFEWHDYEMISIEQDIWETKLGNAKPGMQYQYNIELANGGGYCVINDPYARALTNSMNGKGIITDNKFSWGKEKFKTAPRHKQVIYELHVGTFNRPDESTTGTLTSAMQKLSYLKNLGINMIELMPVNSMWNDSGWGYNPMHLFSVEESYGGRRALQQFVKSAHKRGIGVILDIAYNHMHMDSDTPWQYFRTDDFRSTPWGPRFDFGKKRVREYICDNVKMWLEEYQLDGLRLDSTIYLRKTEANGIEIPDTWRMVQEINRVAHVTNRRALVIAEDDSTNDWMTKGIGVGGAGFDAQWGLGFASKLRECFGVGKWPYIGNFIDELNNYYNGDWLEKIIFSESHDTASSDEGHGRLDADFDSSNPLSLWAQQKVLLAAGLTMTAPGAPMILAGQEFMQPGEFSALEPLDWDLSRAFWPNIVLAHKHLIALRKNVYGDTAGLTGSDFGIFHVDHNNKVLAFTRGNCIVIANFGEGRFDDYTLRLPFPGIFTAKFNSSWGGYHPEFANLTFDYVETSFDNKLSIPLAEYSIIILSQ